MTQFRCTLPEPAPRPTWVDGHVLLNDFVAALLAAPSRAERDAVMAAHARLVRRRRRRRGLVLRVVRGPDGCFHLRKEKP